MLALLAVVVVPLLVVPLLVVPVLVAGPSTPVSAYPAGVDQLITVRTSSPAATEGRLRTYDRVDGTWKLRLGPTTVRVGAAGGGQGVRGLRRPSGR